MSRYPLRLALLFASLLSAVTVAVAVRGNAVAFLGGTAPLPAHACGTFHLGSTALTFKGKNCLCGLRIPLSAIRSIRYGEKSGRRVGLAIGISPAFLLSHKRRHFLTLFYVDQAGRSEGALFEVSKGQVHSLLKALSAATHLAVKFETKEAEIHAHF